MKCLMRYPGSKKRIAPWIIEHFPEHHSYLEPYFGSGAVLFEKEPSRIETVNDIDGEIYNLFTVIRNNPDELIKRIEMTPYSRQEYNNAFIGSDEPVEKARLLLVKSLQSHVFRLTGGCGWKNDVQGRERAYCVKHWNELPEIILQVVERLKQVQIENMPAVELIKRFNYSNVLVYADPPYLMSTRTTKQYRHEMTDNDHIDMLLTLMDHKGPVILSGYDNELYNTYLCDWRKDSIAARAEHGLPRTETIWMNF